MFSVFQNVIKIFCECLRMDKPGSKTKTIERKCLSNMWKNQFLNSKE